MFLKIFKIVFLITFLFIGGVGYSLPKVEAQVLEPFYLQLKRCVLRLEHVVKYVEEGSDITKSNIVSDGTAFFVAYKNSLYIVSARHVVEQDYDLHVRVPFLYNVGGEIKGPEEVILMKLPRSGWVFHPLKGDEDNRYVDVAVMKISPPEGKNIVAFFQSDKNNPDFKNNQLPEKDPLPPAEVIIFGYPLDIGFKLKEQSPFGRRGMIAFVADEKFIKGEDGKYFEERCYLIDVEVFPGNSGSPAIGLKGSNIELLGLIIATNERQDFAVAEPISRILETLQIADEKALPLDVWGNVIPEFNN